MPDPKLYIEVLNDGSQDLYIRDAEAQEDIAAIYELIKNGSKYIGKFTSAVVGGETVTELHQGDVVTSITTSTGTYVTGTPSGTEKPLNAGDYTQYEISGKNSIEWMWNGTNIDEFGSTSVLKALAFKDSASGSYTPAGTNAPSAVSFTGQTDGDFVTGFNDDAVAPSFQEGAFTPAAIQSGFATAGSAASFTEGAFSAGTLPSKAADSFDAGSLPTKAADTFSQGSLPSMTYDETNRKLTFGAGSLPTFQEGAFSQGSLPSFTEGAFDAGSLPSKAADSFTPNVPTAIDTTKFSGGSKAADTFNAGSAATPTTGKAITAVGTGEAAAQTFTGTAATITVS